MPTQPKAAAIIFCMLGSTSACNQKEPDVAAEDLPPIACRVDSLTPSQRDREGELLEKHLSTYQEVREHGDGYSFRYSADVAQFSQIAELVGLEHLCCPFLDFRLEWAGASESPWLHVSGGSRVKSFVESTFTRQK